MFSFRCLLFLNLLLPITLYAQIPQYFTGLARTQVQYLDAKSKVLQAGTSPENLALHLPPGQQLTDALTGLRQDLINLPAITRASFTIDSSRENLSVEWDIEEARTLFPLLDLGGVKGNFYYLLGFTDSHFRGRGQSITAFYQNIDGQHNYYLSFTNPNLNGSRWGYQLESRRYAAIEPLYFPETVRYIYSNLNFGAGISYTTPNRHVFRFGLSNFYEDYRKTEAEPGSPGPRELKLNKGLLKLSHGRRKLDYHWERLAGTANETVFQAVRTFNGTDDNFLIAWHDFRYYRMVGKATNLAVRLRAGVSTNNNSPFAPFVLDSQVNIRGSGNRIDRGTAQLILNLEYRLTALKDQKDRFALQAVGFSDLGSWRNPGGEISDIWDERNFRHFVGGGLRFISLKAYNAVLRLDYGVDVRHSRERGFVAGFGQYF
ncbi:outer membrane protein assembly factor [Neolewinella aurantiaca]|uniref:Outer membrane protein assembly factor n=1 Tax=Neolewinella aurantiaca TaxID=2602767 RepID=A0A5C7FHW7_9BACT|nr:outer membrane protein assembly factor [Neolewinella aurantiaca]TXF90091.1 outer membrane protein assembly factor [Neolewinella aurantiaca]